MLITLTNLPGRFIRDCLECDCGIGDAIFNKQGRVTLRAYPHELDELRSRAIYYADPVGMDEHSHHLGTAARALLKRLPAASE